MIERATEGGPLRNELGLKQRKHCLGVTSTERALGRQIEVIGPEGVVARG